MSKRDSFREMTTLDVPEIKDINQYWFGNNPQLSHFMSSLSVLFEEGEKFFMRSMNQYRLELTEEQQAVLNDFCKQEINHSKIHKELNSLLNSKLGNESINKNLLTELEKETQRIIQFWSYPLSKRQKLVITLCLEHITAIMGKQLLERTDLHQLMVSSAKDIWLYHQKEELEHQHVSPDLFNYTSKSKVIDYIYRIIFMPFVSLILQSVVMNFWFRIMKNEPNGFKGLFQQGKILFGLNGFITNMTPEMLKFFKPKNNIFLQLVFLYFTINNYKKL